jgi:hypothetical protein
MKNIYLIEKILMKAKWTLKSGVTVSLLFIIPVLLAGCGDVFNFEVDCDQCYTVEPDSGDIHVRVTINDENPYVPLVIYKDKVEEGVIEYIDTAYNEDYYLWVAIKKPYSAKAKYIDGDKIIYAVDGDQVGIRKVSDVCQSDCWIYTDGKIDLRLR